MNQRVRKTVFNLVGAGVLVFLPLAAFADSKPINQTVESYNGQTVKNNAQVYYPKSMTEYASLIKRLYKEGKKIRVVGRTHSTSDIMMSDGVFISTKNLNKIRRIVNKGGKTYLEVEPGVTSGQMDDYLSKRGLSLGLGFPMFRDLTIAGVVSTGSHGSSWTHKSMVAQSVDTLDVLNPETGKWITLERGANEGTTDTDSADFEALKGLSKATLKKMMEALSSKKTKLTANEESLRRLLFRFSTVDLGASYQKGVMLIEVQPQFNIRITTQAAKVSDMFLEKEKKINWNPNRTEPGFDNSLVVKFYFHAGQAIIEAGNVTDRPVVPGAQNVNFGTGFETPEALAGARDFMAKAHNNMDYGREAEPLRIKGTLAAPLFVGQDESGKEVRLSDLVGPSQNMTRARGETLTWLFRPSDYSVSFPESKAYEILKAIELFGNKTGYSFPFTGVSCRFVTLDKGAGPMSHVGRPGDPQGERYVVMEFLEYRALDQKGPAPQTDRTKHLIALFDLLKSYNVGFHLGKNTSEMFDAEYVGKYYGKTGAIFSWLRETTDPKELIGSGFVTRVLKSSTVAQKTCGGYYAH